MDGEIITGTSQLDSSAITGEFVPANAKPGDTVLAGQINKSGALTVRVSRPFSESSISRVMDLVENATARKAKTEKFMTTFARYYTPAVVLIAAGIAFIPPILTEASFETWIYRALVLLVISCPCALVVSIPLGYFGGIGKASRKGILVKGSNFIDALAAVKTVVFDKTGTLIKGSFKVKEIVNLNGFSKDQLLEFAAAAELHSNHPIAVSIVDEFNKGERKLDPAEVRSHTEISGQGVKAHYRDHSVLVGNDSILHLESIEHPKCEFSDTVAHVVIDDVYAGYILIGDEIKPDAKKALVLLKQQGIGHLSMLTGDNACAASSVPEGRLVLPSTLEKVSGQSVEIASFYMDEFFVTNQQFVDFLNHNLSRINLENGVVKGDGANWYLLGEVHEGYEPIVYRKNEFHVSDPAYTSSPVLRVTGYGASAYANFFDRRLPSEVEWLYAATKKPASQPSELKGTTNYSDSMNMEDMMNSMMGNDWSEKNLNTGQDDQIDNNTTKEPPSAAFFKPNEFNLRALNQGIGEWGLRTLSSISKDKLQDNLFVVMGTLEQH